MGGWPYIVIAKEAGNCGTQPLGMVTPFGSGGGDRPHRLLKSELT